MGGYRPLYFVKCKNYGVLHAYMSTHKLILFLGTAEGTLPPNLPLLN